MVSNSIQEKIKLTVHSLLPDARVLLFGSMARGNANEDSDYDVLVIVNTPLALKEKHNLRGKLNKLLVYALDAPVDVFLNSEEEVKKKCLIFGHIIESAVAEGIEL
ncbi:MAG: nucleotidyltransferase domain-containing protein [Bacteroidia bacterium]|nr:nucleotidyltransferase domain-containing protein [Bacteroidia bacterium]